MLPKGLTRRAKVLDVWLDRKRISLLYNLTKHFFHNVVTWFTYFALKIAYKNGGKENSL